MLVLYVSEALKPEGGTGAVRLDALWSQLTTGCIESLVFSNILAKS